MRIAFGADHRGCDQARHLMETVRHLGHEPLGLGIPEGKSSDYPEQAYAVATAVASGAADAGVLLCGTGIGMSIAANKVHGIRAAVVHDEVGARLAKRHNNANILCLSAEMLGPKVLEQVIAAWLETQFEGGRHSRRLAKIAAIEQGLDPASVTDES